MKIVLVLPLPIFPVVGGNRARFLSMTSELKGLGHEVDCIFLSSKNVGDYDHAAHEQEFGPGYFKLERSLVGRIHYLAIRVARELLRRLRSLSLKSSGKIDRVDEIFYSPYSAEIKAIAQARGYDVAIVHYVTMSRAFASFPISTRKILDTHDSFQGVLSEGELRKGLLRADIVYATQNEEADWFRKVLGKTVDSVRVQAHYLRDVRQIDLHSNNAGAFIGSSFRANIESLQYFIGRVLPLILIRMPDFKLFVAGSICRDIEDHPSVVKLGTVKSIADAFVRGPLLINSTIAGTGLKIKLLEAMALGVPAVSTMLGVTGLDSKYLSGVRICPDDDAEGYAEAVMQLARNRQQRIELGGRALQCAHVWNEDQRVALKQSLTEPLEAIRADRP